MYSLPLVGMSKLITTSTFVEVRWQEEKKRWDLRENEVKNVMQKNSSKNEELSKMADRNGREKEEGRTAGISRPRLATSVAIKMLRCLDLNLLRAPSRLGCDICPCKQVASKPRLRSKRASRCVPGDRRIEKK